MPIRVEYGSGMVREGEERRREADNLTKWGVIVCLRKKNNPLKQTRKQKASSEKRR